jgi:hypothetical protein
VGSVKNPLKGSDKKQFYRTLAMCIGIGCGSGWLMPFIIVPYISCIICFFLGLFIGRWLAKQIDYSLVPNVSKTIVCGLLIGMCLSPLGLLPFMTVEILKEVIMSGGSSLVAGLGSIVGMIFSPVCFIAGILRPTVWGEHW